MVTFHDASPNFAHHDKDALTLDAAVELVVRADTELGRVPFSLSQTQIVQLPPSSNAGPTYYCFFPPKREDRPINTREGDISTDPLSLESVKRVGQSYFVVSLVHLQLLLLANPFAYAPRCATWAAAEMIEQSAIGIENGLWRKVIEIMLFVCRALGGDIIGFNALAGNSMRRLHFVSHRPPECIGPYALQQAAAKIGAVARRTATRIGPDAGYPIDAWRFGYANYGESAAAASELLQRWQIVGGAFATATVAAVLEDDVPVLYVVPRNRLLSPFGWPGMAAIMEIMGVGVSSRSDFISRVREGEWGHENFARFLSSLRPHGVERLF